MRRPVGHPAAWLFPLMFALFSVGACEPKRGDSSQGSSEVTISGQRDSASINQAMSPAGLSAVVARIRLPDGKKRLLRARDINDALQDLDAPIRMRFSSFERKRKFLDRLIERTLLALEADASGLRDAPRVRRRTRRVLIAKMRAELEQDLVDINDIQPGDIRRYYDDHLDEFRQGTSIRPYAEVETDIHNKLFRSRRRLAIEAFVDSLRRRAKIERSADSGRAE